MSLIKRRSSSRTGLFLIELIVTILFFALASAVCMQLFVKAHLISTHSSDLSMALNEVQSATECFKSSDGSIQSVATILGVKSGENANEISVYYDKNWNITDDNIVYELTLSTNLENPVVATITVTKSADKANPIYQIEAKKYLPQR
ncbi:MAG: hypothetical protein WAX04_09625 [Oscillospiraceae bacterium]